jgi:hypothetical protein
MKPWKIILPISTVALCLTAFAANANLFEWLKGEVTQVIHKAGEVAHNEQIQAAMGHAQQVAVFVEHQGEDLVAYYNHGKDYNQIHDPVMKTTFEGFCKLGCNFFTCTHGFIKTTCSKACPEADTTHCRSAQVTSQ